MNYQQIIDEINRELKDLRSRVNQDCTLNYALENGLRWLTEAQEHIEAVEIAMAIRTGTAAAYNVLDEILGPLSPIHDRFAVQKIQNVMTYLDDPIGYAGQHALYGSLEPEEAVCK